MHPCQISATMQTRAVSVLALLLLTCVGPSTAANFGGANSYYLHTLQPADQVQVLDAMQAAGFKAIRVFVSPVPANNKGSGNAEAFDVESPVGVWNDSILDAIDALMLRASQRGMKLIIALHDRYLLGCWGSDAYVAKYNLPVTTACGSAAGTAQNDVTLFYTSPAAAADMDRRFAHIVAHRSRAFGNREWSDIPEAILGFDIQNESQAHGRIANPDWVCARATKLRPRLPNRRILILTGGGAAYNDSALSQHFACAALDVVAVHSYDSDFAARLPDAIGRARASKKRVIVEEFGASGGGEAGSLQGQISQIRALGVPWMVWQVVKPNNFGDFETFTDDTASWGVLSSNAFASLSQVGAFAWPELSLLQPPAGSPPAGVHLPS